MKEQSQLEVRRAEAHYWDRRALGRTKGGRIPLEADLRRATRVVPTVPEEEPVDPLMNEIVNGKYRRRFLTWAAPRPGGRVLDIGCGPGWLALELGRFGLTVDAYDLSSEAIAFAERMREENPYSDGFGEVNYVVGDVTTVDLGHEKYDAVTAWSALHHLPNLPEFLERLYHAVKPGGHVVLMDDYPQDRQSRVLQRLLSLILPTYDREYGYKLTLVMDRFVRRNQKVELSSSPMEGLSTVEIDPLVGRRFSIVESIHFGAFVTEPLHYLKGPDWFRYNVGRFLVWMDESFCKLKFCTGVYRIRVWRK